MEKEALTHSFQVSGSERSASLCWAELAAEKIEEF